MPKGRGRPKKKIVVKNEYKENEPNINIPIPKYDVIIEGEETKQVDLNISKEQRDKKERLVKFMNEVNREFKSQVIKFAKDEPTKEKVPFDIKELDDFTGGGIIRGNVSIIYGSEGCGKSTLALNLAAAAQRRGLICHYYDLEHMFDKDRAIKMGVNVDELIISEEFETAEESMDSIINSARAQVIDVIIVDSVQAFSTKEEQEGKGGKERKMEENEIASLAKKMGKFLRKVGTPIYKGKVALLLIGQARTGGLGTFIVHEELTGGRAQKFWSLLTLYMRKGQGADAPMERVELEDVDPDTGKKIKVNKKIGFDTVLKVEKTKTNSKPEGTDLHLQYFFSSGFLK
jgi:RecA/RadA recombinase